MRRTTALVAVCVMLAAPVANADLVCPKGSLSGLLTEAVWVQYKVTADAYLKQLHARLSRNLGEVARVRGTTAKVQAATEAGKFHAVMMKRMFEQGFIAATDILFAYCVIRPDDEPWDEEIEAQRREKWCREWPDAHFC